MKWNMAPEAISTVVLIIIWVYSHKGNPTPSLKNQLFQVCLLTTFLSMSTNIISTVLIYTLQPETLAVTWLFNIIYFISTPLMGMVYFFYALANIYENHKHLARYLVLAGIPGVLYTCIILLDPFTGAIFQISLNTGYTQGAYIFSTYIIFYFYCLICMITTLSCGRKLPRAIQTVLFAFPFGAGLVIVIQMCMPDIVLSGSAATCSLLLIYLYLQNRQLCIDHLTMIPNRQEFLKMLELHVRWRTPFTLFVLSLQEFKRINDLYGQHIGDALLKKLSQYLHHKQLELQKFELYRYSGDEFILLLDRNDQQRIEYLTSQILTRFALPWDVGTCSCLLSASIGIAHYPDTSEIPEELINGLEFAVSQAKKDSANQHICVCTPALLEQARRRETISELLRLNVQNGGFEVYFQPIWSVGANRFILAEALLRLNNTPLGNISPAEFIPIAEDSGLIIDITYLMLEKVLKKLRSLLEQGIKLDGISVNFSPLQFIQADLIPRITELFERCQVPFSKIKIEITESALLDNSEPVIEAINRLHELGIQIGLDDFGTGYSNFASVIKLPFDIVKLDKSLIWSAMTNEHFAIIVQNITHALRDLDLRVLAEGVENEAQRKFVVDCGCHYIQGFYYARPMDGDAFEAFLKK